MLPYCILTETIKIENLINTFFQDFHQDFEFNYNNSNIRHRRSTHWHTSHVAESKHKQTTR